ncbi:hypothetical protein A1Q2_04878 [Trichosporon asahii var. asahii CBS 8904]|uniref:Uncharacterized protein n=1 Tax=Trichosporon asahii var. asahii (strain CBS 8904) TaxID=1220162 RepID=K1VIW1_TRIAC|nr:hypothetical protein A1Q2_04878 [Trichosporon asahii var. asahii CBS 8904]
MAAFNIPAPVNHCEEDYRAVLAKRWADAGRMCVIIAMLRSLSPPTFRPSFSLLPLLPSPHMNSTSNRPQQRR